MYQQVFTECEAAAYLKLSRSFLRQSRMNGLRIGRVDGPPFLKLGRTIRYQKSDLDGWLHEHRIAPTFIEKSNRK